MKISTVALWSVALWSSGAWANSAYASPDQGHTDSLPFPNLSSENEAALPFVTLETLPPELETAIALESSLTNQDLIEWSPSLESSVVVHTIELDSMGDVQDDEALLNSAQTGMESNAIAPTPTLSEITEVTPAIEWSTSHAIHDAAPVVIADRSRESIRDTDSAVFEESVSTPDVQWDMVDSIADADEIQTTDLEALTTTPSLEPEASSTTLPDGNGVPVFAEDMTQVTTSDDAMLALSTLDIDQVEFTSLKIFDIAQVSSASFPDISTHWARGFIEPLAENGVVEGFPNGTFQPDATLTRAEFAALLDQSFVLSPIRSSPDFRDVPTHHWANGAIDSAYRSGFISGQSSTQFAPEQSLTRADTLTALANGLSLTPSNSAAPLSTYFEDAVQIPAYARNAIAAALEHEMVVNYPQARRFRPNNATTRAEAAAFLHQALAHLDAIPELDPNGMLAQYIVMPNSSHFVDEPSGDRLLTEAEINEVRQSLNGVLESLETDQLGSLRTSSPAISISNPTGFGADNFTGFANFSYQSRTRFGNKDDATAGLGIGFGDAQENVGFQLSYTVASFGGSRDFGSGGFNAKLHRQLPDRWGVALGWEGFLNIGGDNDFEDTIYGSVSKVIETSEDVRDPFSRIALSAGLGNGRFRTEEDFAEDNDTISPFGSIAFLLAPPVTSIVEWTGQDLAAGLSIAPFKDFPLVITPAVRDITGAGDGARFIISSGLSWQF